MPIVVNPGFVWPPESEPVVSPDGRITAIVDPAHAGVLLRANYDDSVVDIPAQPEKVLRRNLAANPSFEDGATDVVAGNASMSVQSTGTANTVTVGDRAIIARFHGTYSSAPDSWIRQADGVPVSPGQWLAMQVYIRRGNNGSSPGLQSRFHFALREPDGTYALSEYGPLESLTTDSMDMSSDSPCIRTYSFEVPEGVGIVWAGVSFGVDGDPSALSDAEYIFTDAWNIAVADTQDEAEAAVQAYFDGDTEPADGKLYRYAEDGTSEEYTPAHDFVPGHDATTARVRFERQDGTVVRSGNPAWAPGGYAHAYDHEATLGGGTLWRAVPIRFDGTEGEPSEYVGAVIPALSDGWAWLKPVADPNKAMLLKVEPPDLSYDGRVDTTSIAGSARPAATWDVLEGFTTQLRSLVREKPVADQLMALLDEGPVLAQFPACAGLPDFYFIRGKVDLEHVHWDGYPWRRYQWEVISIDRPDTTDSPLRIPDLSYDTVKRDWTTYDQLAATVDSYNKLLEP